MGSFYTYNVMLNYKPFVNANNCADVVNKINEWRTSLINLYETKVSPENIIKLFNVNIGDIDNIRERNYVINIGPGVDDKVNNMMLFTLELNICKEK